MVPKLVPKHSLLKYFTLTFTRRKFSKFEGSGPLLRIDAKISTNLVRGPWNKEMKFQNKQLWYKLLPYLFKLLHYLLVNTFPVMEMFRWVN